MGRARQLLRPPYAYQLLIANSLSADKYLVTTHRPTDFSREKRPQKVLSSVGGEHTRNDLCWQLKIQYVYGGLYVYTHPRNRLQSAETEQIESTNRTIEQRNCISVFITVLRNCLILKQNSNLNCSIFDIFSTFNMKWNSLPT